MTAYEIDDIVKSFTNKISDALAAEVAPEGKDRNTIDHFNRSVEFDNSPHATASGETSYAIITPPVIATSVTIGDTVVNISDKQSFAKLCLPLGGIQQMNQTEAKGTMAIPEVGSKGTRPVPGKANYQGGLSRLLTAHRDLKTAMYTWLFRALRGSAKDGKVSGNSIVYQKAPAGLMDVNGKSVMIEHMSGMESDQFTIPFGLLIIKQTANGRFIGADFGENCAITTFGQSFSAGNIVIVQNANIFISRVTPFLGTDGKILNNLFTPGQKSYNLNSAGVDGYKPLEVNFNI